MGEGEREGERKGEREGEGEAESGESATSHVCNFMNGQNEGEG